MTLFLILLLAPPLLWLALFVAIKLSRHAKPDETYFRAHILLHGEPDRRYKQRIAMR